MTGDSASPPGAPGPARPGDEHRATSLDFDSVTTVGTESGVSYPVVVEQGAVAMLPILLRQHVRAFRYALISDARVAGLHAEAVARSVRDAGESVDLFTFPAGELHKSREEWSRLTDAMFVEGFGRDACVIALGGGVTGDLAGFVAATYMRGLPVVQVPTSLVAMVDSSVGGKTGVDLPFGKNLVGAFHPPRFVLADPDLARTLPREERSQGLAEAVKHGAILDADYLDRIVDDAPALLEGEPAATGRMVARSVEIKADVVSRDEREGGYRQVLNFGHTLGHAIEAISGYRVAHGSAVSIGMVMEARLGELLGVTAGSTGERLVAALQAVGLPVAPPPDLPLERALDHLAHDKKVRGGVARFVLLEEPGRVHRTAEDREAGGWSRSVPPRLLQRVLEEAAAPAD